MSVEIISEKELENDSLMMSVVDNYTQEAALAREARENNCGIDLQRLQLYRLGVIALTGKEGELLLATRYPSQSLDF